MTTIIDKHRSEIEALCRTYRVRRLDVFGSAVREDFDPVRSDVDFLVEFEPDPDLNTFHAYMDLRGELGIVGEALNRLTREDPDLAARVPDIARIVAFRNVLAPGYEVVGDEVVWNAITVDLNVDPWPTDRGVVVAADSDRQRAPKARVRPEACTDVERPPSTPSLSTKKLSRDAMMLA